MRRTMLAVALLVAIALVTPAVCGGPLPPGAPDDWPDPTSHPTRKEPIGQFIKVWRWAEPGEPPVNSYVDVGEAFTLYVAWFALPTDTAYWEDTGDEFSAEEKEAYLVSVQGRTDPANVLYYFEFDGEPRSPDYSYRGICRWHRWRIEVETDVWRWARAPTLTAYYHYFEFPEGLEDVRAYKLYLRFEYCGAQGEWGPEIEMTRYLIVQEPSP